MKLSHYLLIACVLSATVRTASSAPLAWEPDFGDEITILTGRDDVSATVTLSFPFPFQGASHTRVQVSTNGGIQLGENGGYVDYELWENAAAFYNNGNGPILAPFTGDLDLSSTGTIHFKDFGDRAVITWNEVGTNREERHLVSFQVQLFPDGVIYFSYNGILDNDGEDLVDSISTGIFVGVSGSTGTNPGTVDISSPNTTATDTVYEFWRDANDPINTLFDLDQETLVFEPQAGGGFHSYLLEPVTVTDTPIGKPVLDLLIGKPGAALKGDGVRNSGKPSPGQTIKNDGTIFQTTTATAILLLQNDGTTPGKFSLRSSGDQFKGMTVTARASTGGNVGAAIQAGRFTPVIAAGASVKVTYRLRTDRFYAGILRGGSREDTVRFRLAGAGSSDNAAMVTRYSKR